MNHNTTLTTHIERLSNPDIVVRHEAIVALVKVGEPAVPLLLTTLNDTNLLARRSAMKALLEVKSASAKFPLTTELLKEFEGNYPFVTGLFGKAFATPEEILSYSPFSSAIQYALLKALPDDYRRRRWRGVQSVEEYCEGIAKDAKYSLMVRERAHRIWEERTLLQASRAPEDHQSLLRPVYNQDVEPKELLLRATVQAGGKVQGERVLASPSSGEYTLNPVDGSEMAYIPSGVYRLGSANVSDNPVHEVALLSFYISRNLVTVKQYAVYCKATGKEMPPAPDFNPNWSKIDHPIVNVTWAEARDYALWRGGDLPTEAEWEVASRGGLVGKEYPWGDNFDVSKLCCSKNRYGDSGGTVPVGSYPANGYGLHDMTGNAWEWCMDWYDSSFWNKGAMLDPVNLSKQGKRVLRGGSWLNNYPVYFRCADRGRDYPDNWLYFGGFRVVFEDFFSYPLPFYSFTLFSSCRRCEESKFLFLRCVLVGFSPHHQPLLPSLGEEANARKLKGFLVVCKPEDRYFGNISRDCF